MKIKLFEIETSEGMKNVMLAQCQDEYGNECENYGNTYPRRYFETGDGINDCWGGDQIENLCCRGTPKLLSEIDTVTWLSGKDVYENLPMLLKMARDYEKRLIDRKYDGLKELVGDFPEEDRTETELAF